MAVTAAMAMIAASCSTGSDSQPVLRLLTHENFDLPMDLLDEYTQRTGVGIAVFREPDSTAIVDLLIRTKGTSVADVVVGIDSLDLQRAIDNRTLEPYRPIEADPLDPELLIENDWATPISYLDACLNRRVHFYEPPARSVDELPEPGDIPPAPPTDLSSLLNPVHGAVTVIPDARSSRMGLYFLVALARRFPEGSEQPWPQIVGEMLSNGTVLTDSWEEAYFAHFAADAQDGPDETELSDGTGVTGIGQRVITWGSAGMPAVSVRFQPDLPETIDIAVTGTDCVRITNYAAVIDETPDRRRSGRLIDFMVQPPFQFEIPDRFGSRPARTDLIRTEEWKAFGVTVDAAVIDPFLIGSRWPTWQLTWNQVVTAWRENPDPIETEVEIKP